MDYYFCTKNVKIFLKKYAVVKIMQKKYTKKYAVAKFMQTNMRKNKERTRAARQDTPTNAQKKKHKFPGDPKFTKSANSL